MADAEPDGLARAARRHRQRDAHWRRHGEQPASRNLAMVGAFGWLVVVPLLAGLALGRWLDSLLGGGIMFGAAGVFAGAALGMWLLWRRLHEHADSNGDSP